MVQSGTTILTHVLRQHPDIYLAADQSLLENSWLVREWSEPIEELLEFHKPSRVLLKRPMQCVLRPQWLLLKFPRARYVYCYKPINQQVRSWRKPNSCGPSWCKQLPIPRSEAYYVDCVKAAMDFRYRVKHFKQVFHPDFLKSPQETLADLVNWLGLPPFTFNTSDVSPSIDIKKLFGDFPV